MSKYTKTEIEDHLGRLNSSTDIPWAIKNGKLNKVFTFPDFILAFEFMTKIAAQAEIENHHPEWSNIYNTVEINLVTHELNGISAKDFNLAQFINQLTKQDTHNKETL